MWPPEIRQTILDGIAEGESLRRICERADMPGRRTVLDWLEQDEEFRTKYARAREDQADTIFDGMSEVEDDVISGKLKADAARVVLDSRRWRAEKLKPKKYGAKMDVNHGGGINMTLTPVENQL